MPIATPSTLPNRLNLSDFNDSDEWVVHAHNATATAPKSRKFRLPDIRQMIDYRTGYTPTGLDVNGDADATDKIQAALNSHDVVNLPAGNLLIGGELTIDRSHVRMIGKGTLTRLVNGSANASVIKLLGGDEENLITNIAIKDMSFCQKAGLVPVVGNGAIKARFVGKSYFDHLDTFQYPNSLYIPFDFDNLSQSYIGNIHVNDPVHNGMQFTNCLDIFMKQGRCDASVIGSGTMIMDSEGFYIANWANYGNKINAWQLPKGTLADNANMLFVNVIGDTSGAHNWHITNLEDASFVSCWASAQLDETINPWANGFYFTGGQTRGIDLFGCRALANNAHGALVWNQGGAARDIQFHGCLLGSDRREGVGNGKGANGGYGLFVGDGCQGVKVLGGYARGNASGAVFQGNSYVDVQSLEGFVNENWGNGTIGAGGVVTVNHGLSRSPDSAIMVTRTNAGTGLYVDGVTFTKFDVYGPAGSTFNWQARV